MANNTLNKKDVGKIRQLCDACKKDPDMSVVIGSKSENFIWCKCPECEGVAPYKRKDEKQDVCF
jgi:hypothetical protein